VPISYEVPYDESLVNESLMYVVDVTIEEGGGNPLFVTRQNFPVITLGNPTSEVEVLVEAAGGASPAAATFSSELRSIYDSFLAELSDQDQSLFHGRTRENRIGGDGYLPDPVEGTLYHAAPPGHGARDRPQFGKLFGIEALEDGPQRPPVQAQGGIKHRLERLLVGRAGALVGIHGLNAPRQFENQTLRG